MSRPENANIVSGPSLLVGRYRRDQLSFASKKKLRQHFNKHKGDPGIAELLELASDQMNLKDAYTALAQSILFAPVSAHLWEGFQTREEQSPQSRKPKKQYLYTRFDALNEVFSSLDMETGEVATLMILRQHFSDVTGNASTSASKTTDTPAERRQALVDGFFNLSRQDGQSKLPGQRK